MEQICITGGQPLEGTIKISGAKNAALPLMTSALLTRDPINLRNIPYLQDIETMALLLKQHGVDFTWEQEAGSMTIQALSIQSTKAPYDIVSRMRASFLVLGPLLAREGHACVSLPGGCAIGSRPVDLHLKGLKALGAKISLEDGYIYATAPSGGLRGGCFTFPIRSVTGTENVMMAACLANGTTYLHHAACEPEIVDLADCLNKMGAHIEGAGTNTITIHGKSSLSGATHEVVPDRIETGSYILAGAITKGKILLTNSHLSLLPTFTPLVRSIGVNVTENDQGILVQADHPLESADLSTNPFPGIATDLQAQLMAIMTQAKGTSVITENIFENRFIHVPEMRRMGAQIMIHGSSALIRGRTQLTGTTVRATDLRGSISLILCGLVAQGESTISHIHHLDRGYESVEAKLLACGARIRRVNNKTLSLKFTKNSL